MSQAQVKRSRAKEIRDLFERLGGSMTAERLTHLCIDAGIFTPIDLENRAIRAATDEVRAALRELDAVRLPWAGQSGEKPEAGEAREWKQRAFWDELDYEFNVCDRSNQLMGDYAVIRGLCQECMERYGYEISAPSVTWPGH